MTKNYPLGNLEGARVLITGGLGFIGSNVAHRCLEMGADVVIYDCLDPHSGGNMANVASIKDRLDLVFGDVLDFHELGRVVAGVEVIINCAASTSHPFSMREPLTNIDVNGRGVINLLEAVRRYNPSTRFVHLGTSTQIGPLKFQPATEEHPEFPTDIYSANKSASEKYTLIYGNAYDLPVSVIRLPNVFGPRASIHSPEFTFINYFIGLALQNKEITVYGDGKQLRNILHVDDAVSAILTAATHPDALGEVFFAVGEEHHSVADIAEAVAMQIGGAVRFVDWPTERARIEAGDQVFSNAKIKKILSWRAETGLKQGLEATRQFFKTCLENYLRC